MVKDKSCFTVGLCDHSRTLEHLFYSFRLERGLSQVLSVMAKAKIKVFKTKTMTNVKNSRLNPCMGS